MYENGSLVESGSQLETADCSTDSYFVWIYCTSTKIYSLLTIPIMHPDTHHTATEESEEGYTIIGPDPQNYPGRTEYLDTRYTPVIFHYIGEERKSRRMCF